MGFEVTAKSGERRNGSGRAEGDGQRVADGRSRKRKGALTNGRLDERQGEKELRGPAKVMGGCMSV